MSKLIKFAASAAVAVAFGASQAAPINVGGVVWDPDSPLDFTSTDTMYENIVNAVGDELRGYARITSVNGLAESSFCPGCELTYVFSGYTVSNVDAATGRLTFDGGIINVYVDNAPNWDPLLQSTAADGALFLTLEGHDFVFPATGLTGTLHSEATPSLPGTPGDGTGYLNVTGGLAEAFFDTNTLDTGSGFADLSFTSSFQLLLNPFVSDDGQLYSLFGSNDLQGDTRAVPEPGILSLLSFSLLGFAWMSRRRRS